jgi:3-deoxy-D-manno-octulosonic-acid transferase
MQKFVEKTKWSIFYFLDRLSKLVSGNPRVTVEHRIHNYAESAEYLWVFCSTIGELNACRPFLDHLHSKSQRLVLLTDRDCYKESYLKHFPNSVIVELTGEIDDCQYLCERLPPSLLVVCEIPCTLHDAPCRFSYSLLRAVKNRNRPAYLINGWLYGYQPSSRMDAIEKILFDHDYLSSFDKITVQTEAVKDSLVAKGIDPVRVSVTGNMKFDSILNERPPLVDPVSTAIVDSLLNSGRPVLVAGCITDIAEFSELFQVLIDLKSKYSGLIAVFAPRHPENQELMSDIRNMLDDSGLAFRYKSGMDNADIDNIDLILLDTIGELKAFFYCGDLCYMGKNHNILEPLSFGKPVFTINGWESTYPSYPVYRIAAENGIIRCSENYAAMGKLMAQELEGYMNIEIGNITQALTGMRGATNRNVNFLGFQRSADSAI